MELSKSHLNLSVDAAIVQSCREKGLNISIICEDALRQILNSFENQISPKNCKHKWTWPFSIASGLAKECMRCGTIQKVKVEGHELIFQENKLKSKYVEDRLKELKESK